MNSYIDEKSYYDGGDFPQELRRAANLTLLKQRVGYWLFAIVSGYFAYLMVFPDNAISDDLILWFRVIAFFPCALFALLAMLTHIGFSRAHNCYRILDTPETVVRIYLLNTSLVNKRGGPIYTSHEMVFITDRGKRVCITAPSRLRNAFSSYFSRDPLQTFFPNAAIGCDSN